MITMPAQLTVDFPLWCPKFDSHSDLMAEIHYLFLASSSNPQMYKLVKYSEETRSTVGIFNLFYSQYM